MSKPNILLLDIETLPNIVYTFDLYSPIRYNAVIKEKAIVTFAYKWLGDKKTYVIKNKSKDVYDDKELCEAISSILNKADYIVGHYSDKFDIRFINSRLLLNKLDPIAPVPTIDTYKMAKRTFLFNANRLDYIGKVLDVGRKLHTSWHLWEECAKGNRKAINQMAEYNKQDVELLEKVLLKLLPFCNTKLNRRLFDETCECPSCGSSIVQKRGAYYTALNKRQRYQCMSCGKWYTGEKCED